LAIRGLTLQIRLCLPRRCSSQTSVALKVSSPALLSSPWQRGIHLSSDPGLCHESSKMVPSVPEALGLLDPLNILLRLSRPCLMGFESRVAVGLLILCSQASGLAASVRPHAMASAATTGLFLPSSLGSWLLVLLLPRSDLQYSCMTLKSSPTMFGLHLSR
jgi:hypothetical protein